MRKVPLGTSGAEVSIFCLGAMYFGWRTPEEAAIPVLDQYAEAGGAFIDTANIYGAVGDQRVGGLSEAVLGRWMEARGNRQDMFVASKVGFQRVGVARGLRAETIISECERTLRELRTDYVDLYYAHVDDRTIPLSEPLEALDRLVCAGKVRYVGASNYAPWRLEAARHACQTNGWAPFCCIQQRHTYLRPRPGALFAPQVVANADLLDYCRSTGMRPLAYTPLLGGAYSRDDKAIDPRHAGPDSDARLTALRAVAAEHGATANQVVLAWMLHSDPQVIPLVAASTTAQMAENLAALDVALSADDMRRLNEAGA
jgi:aryl-alcohol dehydrogenase-like predicted oxidoreductase